MEHETGKESQNLLNFTTVPGSVDCVPIPVNQTDIEPEKITSSCLSSTEEILQLVTIEEHRDHLELLTEVDIAEDTASENLQKSCAETLVKSNSNACTLTVMDKEDTKRKEESCRDDVNEEVQCIDKSPGVTKEENSTEITENTTGSSIADAVKNNKRASAQKLLTRLKKLETFKSSSDKNEKSTCTDAVIQSGTEIDKDNSNLKDSVSKEDVVLDSDALTCPTDKCATCLDIFEEKQPKLLCFEFDESKVTNEDALRLIFKPSRTVMRDGEIFYLCKNCSDSLRLLYCAYMKFTKLAVEGSYLITVLSKKKRRNYHLKKEIIQSHDYDSTGDLEDSDSEFITGDVFDSDDDFQMPASDLGGETTSSSDCDRGSKKKLVSEKIKRHKKRSRHPSSEFNHMYLSSDDSSNAVPPSHKSRKVITKKKLPKRMVYKCSLCSEVFDKPKLLRQHLQDTHKTNVVLKIEPKTDDLNSSSQTDLSAEPFSMSDTLLECRSCSIKFPSLDMLKLHFIEVHPGKAPFKCHKCSKSFNSEKSFKRHLISHEAETPYECIKCNLHFRLADESKLHFQLAHEEENEIEAKPGRTSRRKLRKILNCEICGKTFVRQDHLNQHLRTHTGEKPYICNICGKRFCDPRGLSYHEVTHSDLRPYCCTLCGQTFKRLHHLYDHERTHNEDAARPFECEVCGKCFKCKKHLNTHALIHANSKEHVCSVCGKGFNRKDNMQQHLKKVHLEKMKDNADKNTVPQNDCALPANVSVIASNMEVSDAETSITQIAVTKGPSETFIYMHL